MELHQHVRVRTRFDGGWSSAFSVSRRTTDGAGEALFELTRLSDGAVLPALFAERELRADSEHI